MAELHVPLWLQMRADLQVLLYVPGANGHTMAALPGRIFPYPREAAQPRGATSDKEQHAGRGRVGWTSPALVSQAPGSQKDRTELCCFLPLPHCSMDQPASALPGRCFGSKPPALWFPPGPWCQKWTGLKAYILLPGFFFGLSGPITGLCWPSSQLHSFPQIP